MEYKDIVELNQKMARKNIKGKGYAEVAERVQAFRTLFPEGKVLTEMVYFQDGLCVYKATLCKPDGEVLATGHAYEREGSSQINGTSFIENCETSAVGRAASFLGLGSERSIASAEEVEQAIQQQDDRGELIAEIRKIAKEKGISEQMLCDIGGVKKLDQMYQGQMQDCIDWLKRQDK